ncbi:MAG: hypothetical protein JHC95_22790, partial [Solirubrobacteraceae bacterium]|nr:hypothetical protein [Solirubrobacteraceae bacterium]
MTKVVDDPYTLLGDQPYVGAHDPFGFDEVAVELEQLILRSRKSTPFTLGIEAPWGTGKSSLMGQLQRRLDARRDPAGPMVKTVSFNAWVAEGTDVLEGLVKSVLDAMDPSVLRRALRNERLMSVLGFAWRLVAAWLRLGSLADAAWDKLSVDAKTRNQINELVSKAMRDWAERAAKENGGPSAQRMLVVFIDDLDRCSPENVMKIFEAMKLYLSAPGLVFVIGYDDTIVSEAVLARKEYAKQVTGREYVEKVIQIVFRIPRPSGDQTQALVRTLVAQSGTAELLGETECTLLIDRNGRNPRRMKRFLNRFILDYRLDDASGTVRPELLIKLLILESYFPDFTRMMERSDSDAVAEFLDY